MSSEDRDLIGGERVVYTTHLHWVVLVAPFSFAVALVAAGLLFVTRPDFLRNRLDDLTAAAALLFPGAANQSTAFGLGLVLIGAVTATAGLWQRGSTELTVTNRRVTVRTGLALRRTLEILLSKIESIEVEQTLWGQVLGFGSVVVRGTGGTPEPITMVADPLQFRREVQLQIDAANPPGVYPSSDRRRWESEETNPAVVR